MINLSMAEPDNMLRPRITVIGVGGAGGNAINNMIRSSLEGCEFVAANTDAQALAQSLAGRKIQLGTNLSRGLGAGSKPNIGCAAAEESLPDILSILEGSDMLFVTAGMGGGTGTGAAPVLARAARECGILTVGVVTKPFHFEGSHRMRQAEGGIAELQKYVDTLIVIPNQNLFRIANERTTFAEAFRMADEVLHSGVRGITDLMVMPGFMNLDFADVKTVMGEMGKAMMGTGEADGDNRAIRAAEAAISNPLLDDISMKGARGVLINITGGLDMTLFEVDQAANRIREEVDPEAQIKVGSTLGDGLDGRIRVSVIATGIDAEMEEKAARTTRNGDAMTNYAAAAAQARAAAVRTMPQQDQQRSISSVSGAIKTPQPVQVQPVAEQTAPRASGQSSSYFMMPASVSPKVMTSAQAKMTSSPVVMKSSHEEEPSVVAPTTFMPSSVQQAQRAAHMPTDPEVTVLETQDTVQPVVAQEDDFQEEALPPTVGRTVSPRTAVAAAPPVRELPPTVHQAQRQRTLPAGTRNDTATTPDMRVTQLTTASNPPAAASPSVNQRAQSLFQRITGFGMIRPSAAKEMEDELDMDMEPEVVRKTGSDDLPAGPTERSALSGGESDLLDIPAFLRRQSNH